MSSIILPPGVTVDDPPAENTSDSHLSAPQPQTPPTVVLTDEHRRVATELAATLVPQLGTLEECAALLEVPSMKEVVLRFLNLLTPVFAPQIVVADRSMLINNMVEATRDQFMRHKVMGQGPSLHEKTASLMLGALQNLCQTMPPPQLNFQVREEGDPEGSERDSGNDKVNPEQHQD